VWFEVLELATANGGARGRGEPAEGGTAAPTPAAPPSRPRRDEPAERTRVRVAVASAQPTEVALDLSPDAARRTLVVHALRAVDPGKPRLGDVRLEPGAKDEPLTLRIRVPADQPPGVYNGLIIDAQTNRPAGTVSIRVGED
jgi:hypothetical protein